MTVEQHDVIDFVVHKPDEDVIVLVMVEAREWGDTGQLLPDLQAKVDTYLRYVTTGQLAKDYPAARGRPVRIELRAVNEVGVLEREFLLIVAERHLIPAGITIDWKLIV